MKRLSALVSSALLVALWGGACSAPPSGSGEGAGATSGDGDGDGTIDPFTDPAADCGDGNLNRETEACDDGNNDAEDGCIANCLLVEPGFICPTPGEPCVPFARCGDGLVSAPEQCDDGARASGDGCSENCKVEVGYKCTEGDGTTVSACTATVCGDGNVEGAEMCEPDLDEGCTSQCQFAPNCGADGACTSECGDGLVLGEECDDGNRTDGDGCSAECTTEAGYTCEVPVDECERGATGECVMRVPVTYRDFDASHKSFESTQCDVGVLTQGMVSDRLSGGIPQPMTTEPCWAVDEWYTSSSDNVTFHSDLVLYQKEDGRFVNRWGENGELWSYADPDAMWAANTYDQCKDTGCIPCPWDKNTGCTGDILTKDGDPFFFPVDGIAGAKMGSGTRAKTGPEYGYDSWPFEDEIIGGSPIQHNFHFTSEVTFWFPYSADTNAKLEFTGDDDVFVYINGRLALDIGGTHIPLEDSFTITGAPSITGGTGTEHGMEAGKVYEIKVFHAERQTEGSSFRLTLSGFNSARSDCTAVCGDGVIGFGEECDDGANNGGYNSCGPNCTLGEFCGDGIKQENEACDDADPGETRNCSGCNLIQIR